jgi:hypothetical protein
MFFKILLFFVITYYIFKLLGRVVLPWFIANRLRKMAKQQENAHSDFINKSKKNEGKITVEHIPKRGDKDKEGEYVDYEEIK